MSLISDDVRSLLRVIAPAFIISKPVSNTYSGQHYLLARLNGIPLTYLEALPRNLRKSLPAYSYHLLHFKKLIKTILRISTLLERENISYVIIKTLRPYPEDTVDIDILNMGSTSEYQRAIEALRGEGYEVVSIGPHTTDLRSFDGIAVDIYDEINANQLIYIDKRKLSNHVRYTKLMDGRIKTLTNEANLLVLMAHSAIKESYTLACLLTTLHYMFNGNGKFVDRFISLVRVSNLTIIARWYLTLSSILCREAYGTVPHSLIRMLLALGGEHPGAYKTCKLRRLPPYPCDLLTFTAFLHEKTKDPIFKRSLCNQLMQLAIPNRTFVRRLMSRICEIIGI